MRTVLPLTVLLVIVLACVLAPLVAPDNPNDIAPVLQFCAPSLQHLFGTDELGRDVFSRVLYGGRITIIVSGSATILALLLGVIWGSLAALRGGFIDEVLMRMADVFMAVPLLLFALMLVVVFGSNIRGLIAIMALLQAPWIARIIRATAATELRADYCTAATAFGSSRSRLLTHELLPNLLPTIRTQATLVFAYSILLESTLSFIGLGIQPPNSSWGTLLSSGYRNIYQSYYGIVFPGLMIIVVAIALNTLADSYDLDKAL
jgi:peptide/nickel transport system permease protein